MDSYSFYKDDKTSKDDVEKPNSDSSTMDRSDSTLADEDASFLSDQHHYKKGRGRLALLSVPSSPLFLVIAVALTIVTILALNIASLVKLHQLSYRHETGHLSPAHGHHEAGEPDMEESLAPEGLRRASNGQLLECGKDAIAAEANGCLFDVMSLEWTPPACYDEEMLLDTVDPRNVLAPNVAGVFPWYKWANWTEPLDQTAEVLKEYSYVWTNQDWHRGHCLYMWRLLVKAQNKILNGEKDIYVPIGATNQEHVSHCNLLISDKVRDTTRHLFRAMS